MSDPTSKGSLEIRWTYVLGAMAVLAIVGLYYVLPVKDWTVSFGSRMEERGPWGLLIFALVYVVGIILLVPSSIMTVAAGLAFGVTKGFPLVAPRRLVPRWRFW
ncbi:MAG: hypothetical protein R3F24_02775 [Gammaproteobacteria bacterium]